MVKEDRRAKPRSRSHHHATRLIQAILKNPAGAARELQADLKAGADGNMIVALLSAAESLARLRDVDISPQVASIKQRLKRAGFLRA